MLKFTSNPGNTYKVAEIFFPIKISEFTTVLPQQNISSALKGWGHGYFHTLLG